MVLFESRGFNDDEDEDVDDVMLSVVYWDLDEAECLACTSVYSLAREKYSS